MIPSSADGGSGRLLDSAAARIGNRTPREVSASRGVLFSCGVDAAISVYALYDVNVQSCAAAADALSRSRGLCGGLPLCVSQVRNLPSASFNFCACSASWRELAAISSMPADCSSAAAETVSVLEEIFCELSWMLSV